MTAAENKRADNSRLRAAGYRLCVYASGSLITDVFNSFTLISVSCLHLGQNSGKFFSTVSGRIFVRVLLLQIGHITHSIFTMHPSHRQKLYASSSHISFAFDNIAVIVLLYFSDISWYSRSKALPLASI